jgi:hypothetical protein
MKIFVNCSIQSINSIDRGLNENSTFTIDIITPATSTDTVVVLSGLLEGQKYYWRVQGENLAGIGKGVRLSLQPSCMPQRTLLCK